MCVADGGTILVLQRTPWIQCFELSISLCNTCGDQCVAEELKKRGVCVPHHLPLPKAVAPQMLSNSMRLEEYGKLQSVLGSHPTSSLQPFLAPQPHADDIGTMYMAQDGNYTGMTMAQDGNHTGM